MTSPLSEADWKQWSYSPATEEFLGALRESKADAQEAWAHEAFIGADFAGTALANATALGGVRVLNQLIDLIETHRASPEDGIERVVS